MRFTREKKLTKGQREEILELWNNEYPANLQYKDIAELDAYLLGLADQNHILLVDPNHKIRGWYADFIRNKERWFLTIFSAEFQGRKLGTQILDLAKERNEELNGWVIDSDRYRKANGEAYHSPVEFYRKNGFRILPSVQLRNDTLSAIKVQWVKSPRRLIQRSQFFGNLE